ncbi:MAG TPA: DUF4870 domain-containing protein [Candidatus Eremiobacteraeota bacterium]|nr:MAG: Chloroplast import component protein (Tic20) [bacterium ADurb.Bin363]HPZ10233.1 DUF4870 domain-containing protein [Candidatus Eremiobacteraeota bacterium]
MGDTEDKNTNMSAASYVPIIGLIVSIYNLCSENKKDPYCRFHSYHALFFWLSVGLIIIGLTFINLLVGSLPLIKLLSPLISIAILIIQIGCCIYGLICAYKTFAGESFSIPVITEYTNNYLKDKKMLP